MLQSPPAQCSSGGAKPEGRTMTAQLNLPVNALGYGRELRLLTPASFQTVFTNPPVKAVTKELTMLAVPNQLEHPRIGITVSKKRAKRAVDRNRIKRQIRETFRLKQVKIPPFDIVIIAKPGIAELDNAAMRERLDYLWRTLSKRCKQYLLAASDSTSG